MRRSLYRLFVFLWLGGCTLAVCAQQEPAAVKQAVAQWLTVQTRDLPGQVSFEVGELDADNLLAPCTSFDIARPGGALPWGRSSVLVRCLENAGWRVYIPIRIRVEMDYPVSARPILRGKIVAAEDLTTQFGDLSEMPPNIVTDAAQALGKSAAVSIPAGRPLRMDMLRAPTAVRLGQTVKVVSRGAGFEVTNEGRALNNALEGQVAQVRLGSGQVVNGIARLGGVVEVSF